MHHEVTLIATIAVCFVLASIFGYMADRLRLPPLVGYLVAGVMIGPFTPGIVADGALAAQLAEMGVILLMFGVGLHFSASDLLAVRGVAVPGAIGQIVLATLLGVGLASMWGWSIGAGIVLGLSLSVASTVVLLKALEERNLLNTPSGRVAVGWLIVEDLAMVLALVLLPALAEMLAGSGAGTVSEHVAEGGSSSLLLTLAITLAKVAVFAALAIFLGPKVVPWVLTKVARTGSRELFTLSVLALAVGIAYGSAEVFGVSFALGAFFAGLVLGESHLSHKAAAESLPLQDAFSVVFFVSVGMLFDPSVIVEDPIAVLGVLAVIMVGKSVIGFLIVILLRYPVSMGLMVAGSLAQIGEFSFILVGLGLSLGLIPTEGQDLILAGALLSITLNPLAFYVTGELQKWVRQRWPAVAAGYGRAHHDALVQELARIRAAQEARDEARHVRIQELVATFPLLSLVPPDDQEELLLLFRPASASPGERVIRTGDRADGMYFISSGAVEVRVGGRAIRLDAGSFFGEMALLSGSRRTADVIAVDFCEFQFLERRDFTQFMARHPELRAAVDTMARERIEANRAASAVTQENGAEAAQ
ncbi:cation:proton antiporter [Mesorhizobium sp. LHD-90]|uniref:cation:proton antiporter domain-containing protein n=1 Tax=Mesorhizobium sp. LHD-90 TaxID=3071414 RepID=UPI0027E134A7|nr:cation:proton antiporter [Mesorhizobium sp. LHD-90]MDQ6432727.1 cation:proton antiporter [Mesorhizobium sp. LHD-90]